MTSCSLLIPQEAASYASTPLRAQNGSQPCTAGESPLLLATTPSEPPSRIPLKRTHTEDVIDDTPSPGADNSIAKRLRMGQDQVEGGQAAEVENRDVASSARERLIDRGQWRLLQAPGAQYGYGFVGVRLV